ncbi:hypothetical protein A3306_07195 [Rickettsia bellii]|uniref:Uncharacterized protein n=1 Tax=Rickettsia bellii str. RML An4 TaxID=1359193 RepID=A0A0F3QAV0_RICBE|nr:hypothetical protein A3306_07195 [Rickettsia bellii]KJV89377.1 hypothetical protein RBEAN4_0354 [Rickettsia bellii str. RML An4]
MMLTICDQGLLYPRIALLLSLQRILASFSKMSTIFFLLIIENINYFLISYLFANRKYIFGK